MGQTITQEVQLPFPEGVRAHLLVKFPLRDLNGKVIGICGFDADISQLKKVERELALRNERLSLIARLGGIVGATVEEQGRRLAELTRTAFGVDGCVIRVLEGDKLVLFGSAGTVEGRLEPCV